MGPQCSRMEGFKFVTFEGSTRCLVSPQIGCKADCSYCYLDGYRAENGRPILPVLPQDLIRMVESDARFVKGQYGTVVSFGCFTECLLGSIFFPTMNLIKHFLSYGNRVSIATKMNPTLLVKSLRDFIQYEDQFSVFISCPTITLWGKYERKTRPPEVRLVSIPKILEANFSCYLYVKPFLGEDTSIDIEIYKKYMQLYNIAVVVGQRFAHSAHGDPAPISPERLRLVEDSGYDAFVEKLKCSGTVYLRSLEPLVSSGVVA